MRKSPEKLSDNERDPNAGDDGPWGKEYQESVPPFNPEQKQETEVVDDSDLVQKMIDRRDDEREIFGFYIERLKKGWGVHYDELFNDIGSYYKDIFQWNEQTDDESLANKMEEELDGRERQERILIDTLGEQSTGGSKEFQGKPIEEILQTKIDAVVVKMKTLDESISSAKQAGNSTDRFNEQYDKLIAEKNALANVLGWTEAFRKYSYNSEESDIKQ